MSFLIAEICQLLYQTNRPHSFPRQILPNSTDHFAKFRCSPRQNCSNTAAHRGLTFMSKLNSCPAKKTLLKAGLCSVILATKKVINIFFFVFYVQFFKSKCVYL